MICQHQSQDEQAHRPHACKQRMQSGVKNSMQSTKTEIKEIAKRLHSIRAEIQQEIAETEKKARQYDMLRDPTPQEEETADAIYNQQEYLEIQLDAIDSALISLSYFNALK